MRTIAYRLSVAATALAVVVVVYGAYVRLSHAGLSCPDWPLCYGEIVVPSAAGDIAQKNALFPESPVEPQKAVKEMTHRYLASVLGILIVGIVVEAIVARTKRREIRIKMPIVLFMIVVFQGLLGMWTVTLLVRPAVVTLHLLGGVATTALLFAYALTTAERIATGPVATPTAMAPATMMPPLERASWTRWVDVGLGLVALQIALGGWLSSNYAAFVCPSFPGCLSNDAWPSMNFEEAFALWPDVEQSFEGGLLGFSARVAIHMVHRVFAAIVAIFVVALAVRAFRQPSRVVRAIAVAMLTILVAQVVLGVFSALGSLSPRLMVLHNAGGLSLILVLVLLRRVVAHHLAYRSAPAVMS